VPNDDIIIVILTDEIFDAAVLSDINKGDKMPLGPKTKRPKKVKKEDIKKDEPKKLDFSPIIRETVMERLGKPTDFWKVDAKLLWENRYRVNVWTETMGNIGPTHRIVDSFFIIASPEGGIVESRPQIYKKYGGNKPEPKKFKKKMKTIADIMKP